MRKTTIKNTGKEKPQKKCSFLSGPVLKKSVTKKRGGDHCLLSRAGSSYLDDGGDELLEERQFEQWRPVVMDKINYQPLP